MFTIVATRHFLYGVRNFLKRHPDLRDHFVRIIDDFRKEPYASRIVRRELGDKYKGLQVVSITEGFRIALTVAVVDKEIILLDVGSHAEVNR